MAGTVLASFDDSGYGNFEWRGYFDLQQRYYEDTYQTYLVQRALNACYDTSLYVDGDFGTNTYNAVHSFQTDTGGLTIDGKVGEQTWNAMQDDANWFTAATAIYDLDIGYSYVFYTGVYDPVNTSYIRHYSNNRWRVQRENGDWRYTK